MQELKLILRKCSLPSTVFKIGDDALKVHLIKADGTAYKLSENKENLMFWFLCFMESLHC